MKRTLQFICQLDGISVNDLLLSQNISSKAISTLKRQEKGILVNEKEAFSNYILKKDDVVTISLNEENDNEDIIPVKMDLDIRYEDEDLIIVNKPFNLTVHPSKKYFTNTLSNGLAYYYLNKNEDVKLHCITRLDKDTSGLVLFAKNRISANYLSNMVKNKEIKKIYYGIVSKKVEKTHDSINGPISRVEKGNILRTVNFENGKEAITHYQLIKYYPKNDVSLLRFDLETGRTHQIRVHCKYINHPIVGDELYNKENKQLNRQALHCYQLIFTHPISKKEINVVSELASDMLEILV